MEQNQEKAAIMNGGRYYPRKMRRGWCVAHEVKTCGVTIERFGLRFGTYAEAFSRADRMNREEAEAVLQATAAAADAALRSPEACTPQHPGSEPQHRKGGATL